MLKKGKFLAAMTGALVMTFLAGVAGAVTISSVKPGEDVLQYVKRSKGQFDHTFYQQVIGAANAFKEGDEAIGVAADSESSRENARKLLANTKIKDLHENPLFVDGQEKLIRNTTDKAAYDKIKNMTMGELKTFLLTQPEAKIKAIMGGLHSDVIGSVVKLMSNDELIRVGQKIFTTLPGSQIGAKGYLSARIQPNSPTDNVEDIQWQVLDGFAYAVGDIVIGTNPVDSQLEATLRVQNALKEIVTAFKLEDTVPWCVLAHIDGQAAAEKAQPGSTAIWFQSLAGTESANKTFDLTIQKMLDYAKMRTGPYGLYFETGQGADFTNGHGHGFDMVVHESRKYGFARALKQEIAKTKGIPESEVWLHLNDVAGFIGPEVFKTREQLVRCCLEDIVMGKLHGLVLGLDICSTLHMPVTLDDLEWCQDQIAPANPAYLMGLPTRNDPMLSYLTTGYQDHVRLREKFGFKVNDAMWAFFKKIEVIDANGKPTKHFGDPAWVYYKFLQAKGDKRPFDAIYAEGQDAIKRVRGRGVDLAVGYGENIWDLEPVTRKRIHDLYDDAKVSLWAEFTPEFINSIPNAVSIASQSHDRENYIAAPATGEELSESAVATLDKLAASWGSKVPDVQVVISDGLNARATMDEGHLMPYLNELKKQCKKAGLTLSDKNIVVTGGRVRAGYKAGEILFDQAGKAPKAIIHIIGERPGSGHSAYSVYLTKVVPATWAQKGAVDHDQTKVLSGIADTGLLPAEAARQTVNLLKQM
ncbi:MAG: ethanolamine ammonia-lyase [Syntrophotaleaceae bacterium]